MQHAEQGSDEVASETTPPRLEVIDGDQLSVWTDAPEKFGVTGPIDSEIFHDSNVLRSLSYEIAAHKKEGKTWVKHTVPQTPAASIIGEIFRKCLPEQSRQMLDSIIAEALAAEAAFKTEENIDDPDYQAHLAAIAEAHESSLLMQGLDAFWEASMDYDV